MAETRAPQLPQVCEPNELPTVSKISRKRDPYQLHDVQERFVEEDHRALFTEEVEEFGKFRTADVPDSK